MVQEDVRESLQRVGEDDLGALSTAATTFLAIVEEGYRCGWPVLLEVIGETPFVQWEHYPPDDLFDPTTGMLAFYHAHPPGDRRNVEHGHFHCFVECRDIPPDLPPLARPRKRAGRRLCHVAGVSVDMHGVPTALFVPNQWVTGEWMYPADIAIAQARRVSQVDEVAPRPLRWLAHLLTMFEPQITALLHDRDRTLGSGRAAGRRARDRAVEILASQSIDIDERIEAIFTEVDYYHEKSLERVGGTDAACGQS